jgi:hypothetical protein
MHQMPDHSLLVKRYKLCPEYPTGLSVKYQFNSRCKPGQQAGAYDVKSKRSIIQVNGKNYKCSRVVYYLATEIDPGLYEVDHIDQDSSNNSIENLRLSTRSQNAANMKLKASNTTGYKGVSWHKARGLFRCTVGLGGTSKQLANHICPARLAYSYNAFVKEHYKEFAVLNSLPNLGCV